MNDTAVRDTPLERYVSLLEAVAPFAEGLTAAELEVALDLPKTTVNRLLHALAASGLVVVSAGGGGTSGGRNRLYRLGDRVLRLLDASPDTGWLARLAQRPLQALADRTGQSAFISKFDGFEVRSVTCVAPDSPIRTFVMPGMAMPANAAATAKAILAFQPEAVARDILAQESARHTDATRTGPEALMREFAEVRALGYATDLAEHVAGLGSIAVPIRPPGWTPGAPVVYAVGLTGPYERVIGQGFESHRAAIVETAGRLGQLLALRGGARDGP